VEEQAWTAIASTITSTMVERAVRANQLEYQTTYNMAEQTLTTLNIGLIADLGAVKPGLGDNPPMCPP